MISFLLGASTVLVTMFLAIPLIAFNGGARITINAVGVKFMPVIKIKDAGVVKGAININYLFKKALNKKVDDYLWLALCIMIIWAIFSIVIVHG